MSNIHKIAFANAILQECMESSIELPSIRAKASKISASPLIENLKRIITKESRCLIKRNHHGSQHYGKHLTQLTRQSRKQQIATPRGMPTLHFTCNT